MSSSFNTRQAWQITQVPYHILADLLGFDELLNFDATGSMGRLTLLLEVLRRPLRARLSKSELPERTLSVSVQARLDVGARTRLPGLLYRLLK